MAAAAPIVGLAITVSSALGSFAGASKAAQGDQFEAQNAVNAAQIGQTKAAETDANMRRRLTSHSPTSTRSAPGLGLTRAAPRAPRSTPTSKASPICHARRPLRTSTRKSSDQQAAQFYTSAASSALLGGDLGAPARSSAASAGRWAAITASSGWVAKVSAGCSAAFLAWRGYRWRAEPSARLLNWSARSSRPCTSRTPPNAPATR